MITEWTEVLDPATLKEGDRIQVRFHKGALIEDTIMNIPPEVDAMGDYWFSLRSVGEVCFTEEGITVFVATPPFAIRNNPLKPGEVVEDASGTRYTPNPLNPALIITSQSGLTGPEEFIQKFVRAVR